jgi:hypothetical protein
MIDRYATAEGRDALVNAYLSGSITPNSSGMIKPAAVLILEARAAAKAETMTNRWLAGKEPPFLDGKLVRSRLGLTAYEVIGCALDATMPSGWAVQAHGGVSGDEAITACAWSLAPVVAQGIKSPTLSTFAGITEEEALVIAASVEDAEASPWDAAPREELEAVVAELVASPARQPVVGRLVDRETRAAQIERDRLLDGYYERDHQEEPEEEEESDDEPPAAEIEDVIERDVDAAPPRVMKRLVVLQATHEDRDVAPLSADEEALRPRTRGDCAGGPRPCPWVSCRHNLYLDAKGETLHLTWSEKEPGEVTESCALDIADRGAHQRHHIGAAMNVSHEMVRSIEQLSLGHLWTTGQAEDLAEFSAQEFGDKPLALTNYASSSRVKIFTKDIDMSDEDRAHQRDAPARALYQRAVASGSFQFLSELAQTAMTMIYADRMSREAAAASLHMTMAELYGTLDRARDRLRSEEKKKMKETVNVE